MNLCRTVFRDHSTFSIIRIIVIIIIIIIIIIIQEWFIALLP